MQPLDAALPDTFSSVRFLLTDMDETLTHKGRLAAKTYEALERLQTAGVVVIPVTAAPGGWCDQMARMWPIDGVIAENGGLFIRRAGHGARRDFWSNTPEADRVRLAKIATDIAQDIPTAALADDQPFRLASLAFQASPDEAANTRIEHVLKQRGLLTTRNNLWVLGWVGDFDKLNMARRTLARAYGLDIDLEADAIIYVGDSTNDAPMFSFFRHTVGVSTVRDYLPQLSTPPAWVTRGPGGSGFVEVVDTLLRSRPTG